MSVQPQEKKPLKLSALPDESFMADYNSGVYDYEAENDYRVVDEFTAPGGAKHVGEQMMSAGSPGKAFQATEKTFPYTVAFGVPKDGAYPSGEIEVNITADDLKELFAEEGGALANQDLNRALVTGVRITGKTLPQNSKYALQLFDGSSPPKALYTQSGYKSWDSGVWRKFGYPLFTSSSTNGQVFQQPANISEDLRRYGNIKMSDITNGVVRLSYPPSQHGQAAPPDMALIPKTGNGPYFVWALEVVNPEVKGLLTSELFQDPNNPNNFRLPWGTYEEVVTAYENKINDVQSNFHNLSKITAKLVPLENGDTSYADAKNLQTEYITLEFTGQMTDSQ